jgi:hypothetical protein
MSGAGLGGSPAAAGNAGPSEYTMMMQKATPPPPAAAPKPEAANKAPAPAKKRLPLGLIIGLNVIGLLIIALILYFVLRPAPVPATAPGGDPATAEPAAAQATESATGAER